VAPSVVEGAQAALEQKEKQQKPKDANKNET